MSHRPSREDSAGQPWAGRSFETNAFSGDPGLVDPNLAASFKQFASGDVDQDVVVDAFRAARLLIPLVARAGEVGVNQDGVTLDKSQELSIVTVTARDGRKVLPVFSSVDSMMLWRPDARPVPASGVRVALAAAADDTELVILDPMSSTEFGIRRPALWSIAQELPWIPPWLDPDVFDAFVASISSELSVLEVSLGAADPASRLIGHEVTVSLELLAGLTNQELDVVIQRLAGRWSASDTIATRIDSLAVKLSSATLPPS